MKKIIYTLLIILGGSVAHAQWKVSVGPNGENLPMNLDANGYLKTVSSPLPTGTNNIGYVMISNTAGSATSANQSTEITWLTQIHTDLVAPLPSGTNTIGSVTVSGVATSANQATSNGYLATIATTGSAAATAANQTAANSSLSTIATTLSTGTNAVVSYNSEVRLTGSFARPANVTPYVSGYLVANSTTAGSVVPVTFVNAVRQAGDCVRIERCSVTLSGVGSAAINQTFKVHIFQASPTVTVGDGAAFDASGVLACNAGLSHAGGFAVTMMFAGSDGSVGRGTPDVGSAVTLSPSSGTSLYALIEATSAYTPVSGQTVTVTLEGYRP